MADELTDNNLTKLTKRLGGAEDLSFDVTGEGLKNQYEKDGELVEISKLNASHLPVTKKTAIAYGLENATVDKILLDSVAKIANAISKVDEIVSMDSDLTVTLLQNITSVERQAFIDAQYKNLGGHTLTINFPESIDTSFDDKLEFNFFRNGNLIIDGKDITLSDSGDIGSFFEFNDCDANITIKDITLNHDATLYAVKCNRVMYMNFNNIAFVGAVGTALSAGIYYNLSNGNTVSCTFTNDLENVVVNDTNTKYIALIESMTDIIIAARKYARDLFDMWFSFSSVVKDGTVLLNGQKLADVDINYPDFWSACLTRRDNSSIPTCTEDEWNIEATVSYTLTEDEYFVDGKLYYDSSNVIHRFTVGAVVPENTYYERIGFGQCGKFVIDESLKTVRIPKITKFISGTNTASEIGEGQYDQIEDITGKVDSGRGKDRIGGAFTSMHRIDGADGWYSRITYPAKFEASKVVRTGDEVRPINVQLMAFMQIK